MRPLASDEGWWEEEGKIEVDGALSVGFRDASGLFISRSEWKSLTHSSRIVTGKVNVSFEAHVSDFLIQVLRHDLLTLVHHAQAIRFCTRV